MTNHRVVAVILHQPDRLLLCHRAPTRRWYPDVWDFPGGHIEPEERPEEALRREIKEELRIELEGVDGVPVLRRFRSRYWPGPHSLGVALLARKCHEHAARGARRHRMVPPRAAWRAAFRGSVLPRLAARPPEGMNCHAKPLAMAVHVLEMGKLGRPRLVPTFE